MRSLLQHEEQLLDNTRWQSTPHCSIEIVRIEARWEPQEFLSNLEGCQPVTKEYTITTGVSTTESKSVHAALTMGWNYLSALAGIDLLTQQSSSTERSEKQQFIVPPGQAFVMEQLMIIGTVRKHRDTTYAAVMGKKVVEKPFQIKMNAVDFTRTDKDSFVSTMFDQYADISNSKGVGNNY